MKYIIQSGRSYAILIKNKPTRWTPFKDRATRVSFREALGVHKTFDTATVLREIDDGDLATLRAPESNK